MRRRNWHPSGAGQMFVVEIEHGGAVYYEGPDDTIVGDKAAAYRWRSWSRADEAAEHHRVCGISAMPVAVPVKTGRRS